MKNLNLVSKSIKSISAKAYETYQTKAYIPSNVTLNWGTILEKPTPKVSKVRKKK